MESGGCGSDLQVSVLGCGIRVFRINASKMMGGGWDLRSKFRL